MTWPASKIGGVLGVQVPQHRVRVMNRAGAVAPGSLVMFDITATDTLPNSAAYTFVVGDVNSVFANVIQPATAMLLVGWYAIVISRGDGALGNAADDAEMIVAIRGKVDALVYGTDAAAVTDNLVAVNSETALHSDGGTAGQKCLGFPLTVTAGATAQKIPVIFEGIYGFGNLVDTGG